MRLQLDVLAGKQVPPYVLNAVDGGRLHRPASEERTVRGWPWRERGGLPTLGEFYGFLQFPAALGPRA